MNTTMGTPKLEIIEASPSSDPLTEGSKMKIENSIAVAKRIEGVLLAGGVAKQQVRNSMATACGVNNQAIAKWFDGSTKSPNIFSIAQICAKFGIDMEWVVLGDKSSGKGTPDMGESPSKINPMTGDNDVESIEASEANFKDFRIKLRPTANA